MIIDPLTSPWRRINPFVRKLLRERWDATSGRAPHLMTLIDQQDRFREIVFFGAPREFFLVKIESAIIQ